MRLLKTIQGPAATVKIYKQDGEFIVKHANPAADYFTDAYDDAHGTALHMAGYTTDQVREILRTKPVQAVQHSKLQISI